MDAKEIGNQTAYPWVDEKWQGGMPSANYFGSAGLTKREVAAIAAMQGLCSGDVSATYDKGPCNEAIVARAVVLADALLAKLAKGE